MAGKSLLYVIAFYYNREYILSEPLHPKADLPRGRMGKNSSTLAGGRGLDLGLSFGPQSKLMLIALQGRGGHVSLDVYHPFCQER